MTEGVRYPRPLTMIDIRMTGNFRDSSVLHHTLPPAAGHGVIQADGGDAVILERDFDKVHMGGLA